MVQINLHEPFSLQVRKLLTRMRELVHPGFSPYNLVLESVGDWELKRDAAPTKYCLLCGKVMDATQYGCDGPDRNCYRILCRTWMSDFYEQIHLYQLQAGFDYRLLTGKERLQVKFAIEQLHQESR